MEKLEAMHESLKTIETETKSTNGKVAQNVKDIALMRQESEQFMKKSELGSSLWRYVTALLLILGFAQFLFAGWFENKINNALKDSLKDEVAVALTEELESRYDITIE